MKKIFILFSCLLVQIASYGFDADKAKNLLQQSQPKAFYENVGQVVDQHGNPRNDIQFQLSSGNMSVFISSGKLQYQFIKPATGNSYRLDVSLVGANRDAVLIKQDIQPQFNNYFINNTATTSHAYTRLVYQAVYPNIDWVVYIKDGRMEYDFIVHPGGRVADIQLRYDGAKSIKKANDGSIVAHTPLGKVVEHAPYSYTTATKKQVHSQSVVKGNTVTFVVDKYEGELIIDPVLNWATYYGGTSTDKILGIVCDKQNNIYVAGQSQSAASVATTGSYQATRAITSGLDGFIAKFTSAGVRQWGTYFCGASTGNPEENFTGITCDNAGNNIYLVGYTKSTSGIPTTVSSHQQNSGGGTDAMLVKFTTAGTFQWATYYGGSATDQGMAITIDGNDNVYIAGYTSSPAGIATTGGVQDTLFNGLKGGTIPSDAFIAKFNSAGVRQWGTYYGGSGADQGLALTCDRYNRLYLTGYVTAGATDTLLVTANAHQRVAGANNDAFLLKFNDQGKRIWSTVYGGEKADQGLSVTCDKSDGANVYMGGYAGSTVNIASIFGHQTIQNSTGSNYNAMLVKFDSAGVRQWGTYYGGGGNTRITALACDSNGNVYTAGYASSGDITTPNNYQVSFAGGSYDAFIVKFLGNGVRGWGTYYGGSGSDDAPGLIMTGRDTLYLAGFTTASGWLGTPLAHQATSGGGTEGYIAKFNNLTDTMVYLDRAFADSVICKGKTFNVNYTTTNPFITGNVFTIQLSDNQRSFVNPSVLGTFTATTSGSVTCNIPNGIAPDSTYRIRIASSNIALASVANVFDIVIAEQSPISVTVVADPGALIAAGTPVKFKAYVPFTGPNTTYQWHKNGSPVSGAIQDTCTLFNLVDTDKVTVLVHNPNVCSTVDSAFGNIIRIQLIDTTHPPVNRVANISPLSNIHIYPNPNNGVFTISGTLVGNTGDENGNVIVTNVIGQVVYIGTAPIVDGKINTQIRTQGILPAGMYMVQLRDSKGIYRLGSTVVQP